MLGLASGVLVGFSLGLVGGGGSILAVPLMVYVVGVPDPHLAIGTSAIAVATNAAINLSNHARGGTEERGTSESCILNAALRGLSEPQFAVPWARSGWWAFAGVFSGIQGNRRTSRT